MEDLEVIQKLIRGIGMAYKIFLETGGLVDTCLTRMTYFSTVKKEYVEDSVDNDDVRTAILACLDRWMAQTQLEMKDGMITVLPMTPLKTGGL